MWSGPNDKTSVLQYKNEFLFRSKKKGILCPKNVSHLSTLRMRYFFSCKKERKTKSSSQKMIISSSKGLKS